MGDAGFLVIGLLSGLSAGLLGVGGGIVVVPTLLALGAVSSGAEAVGTSVFVMLVNSTVGVTQHALRGNVRLRRGLFLALGALPMAALGGWGVATMPESLLRGSLAALLLGMALAMWRRGRRAVAAPPTAGHPSVGERGRALVVGGLSGVLAGVFGVGGGILLVPSQVLLLGATMHSAAGTSLVVIALSSAAALAVHAGVHTHVAWSIGLWIAAGGVLGSSLGVRLAQRLDEARLRRAFIGFLVLLSVVTLSRAFGVD